MMNTFLIYFLIYLFISVTDFVITFGNTQLDFVRVHSVKTKDP